MDYRIECRLNRKSAGNFDVFIIDEHKEILFPALPNEPTQSEWDEFNEILFKYSTLGGELESYSDNCIVFNYNFYPISPDSPITPFDVIDALGRWEAPDEPYDMSVSMGRGWSSHTAREELIGSGSYIVRYDSDSLLDFSIKTYEDFKKDLPGFNLQRYIEFWDKYDEAYDRFTIEVPDWYKNE